MSTPPSDPEVDDESADDNVSPHVLCIMCEYSLAGLDVSGKCPECGTPIAESMRKGPLGFLDARDANLLSIGVQLLMGALAMAGTMLAALVAAMLSSGKLIWLFECVGIPLGAAASVVWALGWFAIARVRALGAGAEARFVKRLSIGATWLQAFAILPFLVSLLGYVGLDLGIDDGLAVVTMLAASGMMFGAGHWRLMALVTRGGDQALRLWGTAAGCLMAVMFVLSGAAVIILNSPGSGSGFVLSIVFALVFGLVGIGLWFRFLVVMRDAANERAGSGAPTPLDQPVSLDHSRDVV